MVKIKEVRAIYDTFDPSEVDGFWTMNRSLGQSASYYGDGGLEELSEGDWQMQQRQSLGERCQGTGLSGNAKRQFIRDINKFSSAEADDEDGVAAVERVFDQLLEDCEDSESNLQALVEAVRIFYNWHFDLSDVMNGRENESETIYADTYDELFQTADDFGVQHFPNTYHSLYIK